jgi:hypothetical protein
MLRFSEVSEDRLFRLVFPPIFLPILVDTGKGTADESLGRYGKGIKLSHRFGAVSDRPTISCSGRNQVRAEFLDATTEDWVIWGICESDGWCDRLGDSPEVGEQGFVMSATFFDQAFLLVQFVVIFFLIPRFFSICIASVGESEHRADDAERRETSWALHFDPRNEEMIWSVLKDLAVSGREISEGFGGFNVAHGGKAWAVKDQICSRPTRWVWEWIGNFF